MGIGVLLKCGSKGNVECMSHHYAKRKVCRSCMYGENGRGGWRTSHGSVDSLEHLVGSKVRREWWHEDVMLCYVYDMSCHVMWCYVITYEHAYGMSCYVYVMFMLCYESWLMSMLISCHVMLCYVMLCTYYVHANVMMRKVSVWWMNENTKRRGRCRERRYY